MIRNLYAWLIGREISNLAEQEHGLFTKDTHHWKLHVQKFALRAKEYITSHYLEAMYTKILMKIHATCQHDISTMVYCCMVYISDFMDFISTMHFYQGYRIFHSDILDSFFGYTLALL